MLTLSKVDFVHLQETSLKIHVIKTRCLPLIAYNSGLPLQCLNFVTYTSFSYSVVNLYKKFRQRENHINLKRGLYEQLDVLHTKTQNMHSIPTNLAIFFQLYSLLIWAWGNHYFRFVFTHTKKGLIKKISIIGGSEKDAFG